MFTLFRTSSYCETSFNTVGWLACMSDVLNKQRGTHPSIHLLCILFSETSQNSLSVSLKFLLLLNMNYSTYMCLNCTCIIMFIRFVQFDNLTPLEETKKRHKLYLALPYWGYSILLTTWPTRNRNVRFVIRSPDVQKWITRCHTRLLITAFVDPAGRATRGVWRFV